MASDEMVARDTLSSSATEAPNERVSITSAQEVSESGTNVQTVQRSGGCLGSLSSHVVGAACCAGCYDGCRGTTTTTTTASERAEQPETGGPLRHRFEGSQTFFDNSTLLERGAESLCATFGFPRRQVKQCRSKETLLPPSEPPPLPVCKFVKRMFAYPCPFCSMAHYDVVQVLQNEPCRQNAGQAEESASKLTKTEECLPLEEPEEEAVDDLRADPKRVVRDITVEPAPPRETVWPTYRKGS
jgi:hypothetical protein